MGELEACKIPPFSAIFNRDDCANARTLTSPGVLSFAIWRSLDNLSEHDEPVLAIRHPVAPHFHGLQGFRTGHAEQAKTGLPSPKPC